MLENETRKMLYLYLFEKNHVSQTTDSYQVVYGNVGVVVVDGFSCSIAAATERVRA